MDDSGRVCGGFGGVGEMSGLVGSEGRILGTSRKSGGFLLLRVYGWFI